jgi:hypothetical protein
LQLLTTAPDRISFPLVACVYRAALGAARFSVLVSGPSGIFKTALAAVAQQHFRAGMHASGLPANFASTANALEWLAFAAKGALLAVDDFAPSGGAADAALHQVTERLFRAVGNGQGRSRLWEKGLLVSRDAARQMLPVRRTLAGNARKVLHLRASHLLGPSV